MRKNNFLLFIFIILLVSVYQKSSASDLTDCRPVDRGLHPADPPKSDNPLLQALNNFSPIDYKALNESLKRGDPVNILAKDEYGFIETPLTKAIKRIAPQQSNATNVRSQESVECVKILLDHGADPKMPNGEGVPPLFIAADQGDVPTMELLISKSAAPETKFTTKYNQEIGLVEYTSGRGFSHNAFIYLLEKGFPFDADKVLQNLTRSDRNEGDIRALLAYPVTFSESILEEMENKGGARVKYIADLARKHNQIVLAAKAAYKSPKLLFKPLKAIVKQIDPPAVDGPLIQAIANKDLAQVKRLVEQGADVNSVKDRDTFVKKGYQSVVAMPSVNFALVLGGRDIAFYLLDHGADPDLTSAGSGDSPLALAVRADDVEMAQKLIEKGADVNREIWISHLTPLAEVRSAKMAQVLLERGADPSLADTMHMIVKNKNMDVIRLVISRGGRLDQKSMRDGNTPLHSFIQDCYRTPPDPLYVQFLVEAGAPLDARNFNNQTPYDLAVVQKFEKIADILSQNGGKMGDPQTALANAIIQDDIKTATQALNVMGKIDDQQVLCYLYIYETKHVSREMLELLTAHGADYTTDCGEAGTLLHHMRDPAVIDYLVAHGANVDAQGKEHWTPLHAMVAFHDVKAVQALLKHKAYPNVRNRNDQTPLCLALQGPVDGRPTDGLAVDWQKDPQPYLEIIKFLAQAGADWNMMDAKECRPWENSQDYENFRKEAYTVFKNNAAPVAQKVMVKKHGKYAQVPYNESNVLFMAIREYSLQNEHEKQTVHPVIIKAQEMYQRYPGSADNFAEFLKRIRFHPETNVPVWRNYSDNGLRNDSGESLLHTAAYYGDSDLALQIIDIIGPVQLFDKFERTPLFYAVEGSGFAGVDTALHMVDILKNKGGENINGIDEYGNVPLLGPFGGEVFKDGSTNVYQMIRGLLERGADPALGFNHNVADIVQAGVKLARKYQKEKAGQAYQSLLDELSIKNVLPGQERKDVRWDHNNPLHVAVAKLNIVIVKNLFKENGGFKSNEEGQMLFLSAVSSGDQGLEMAEFLFSKGAKFDAENLNLWSAAVQQDETKSMLTFVLTHAVPPVDALVKVDYRSSHTQAWGEAFSLLLDQGVALNYCVDNPLSKAVGGNDETAVKVLMQYGARKDACQDKIITPDMTSRMAIKELLSE